VLERPIGYYYYKHVHKQFWFNFLYYLPCGYISCRFLWILFGLSSRLLLRHIRPYSSDRCLRGWGVFNFLIKCLLELFCRLLFSKYWIVKLHELLNRNLRCIDRNISLDKLRELFSGLLPVDCWIIKLHFLSRRFILRNNWSDSSDGSLCSG